MPKKNLIAGSVIALVLLPVIAYMGFGVYVYDLVRTIPGHCRDRGIDQNTPENFEVRRQYRDFLNPQPYFITDVDYETVTFPSRGQDDVTISAFYIPAAEATDATVIVVHGLSSCKREAAILMTASMLHDAGFNVLIPDLNDHGESAVVDNKFSAGVTEHLDVLGGYDWLVTDKNIAPENIGVMGYSLGAGTAAIAFAKEQGIAALWADSSYSDLETAINYELRDEYGLPSGMAGSVILMARVVDGVNISNYSPEDAFGSARNDRPVFITHSVHDERLSIDFAYDLTVTVQETQPDFDAWIIDDKPEIGHTEAILYIPEAYEARLVAFFDETLR